MVPWPIEQLEREGGYMMEEELGYVTGGVDTHSDQHVGVVVDAVGRILGAASFPATSAGYGRLLRWMGGFGRIGRVGVEGTGSYGAGLARYLTAQGVEVVEVNRPNRQLRRRRGKSDTTDAEAAARAALNGEASGIPKAGDGRVESIRVLQLARRSAVKARTQTANQIRDLIVTAPDQLRDRLESLDTDGRVETCARLRPGPATQTTEATKQALRLLARRHQALTTEITELDQVLGLLCSQTNPALLGAKGVGSEVAATLLVAAGDNPGRMTSERSFAALCGVSPIEASSGKVTRHRLNRGGNRHANHALWWIVKVRLACDPRTKAYAAHRKAEGKTDREIIRCLKRYVAREIYRLLVDPPEVIDGADLRQQRLASGLSLATVADQIGTWATRLSQLERGLMHNSELADRYKLWLDQHDT
jgi:transposase